MISFHLVLVTQFSSLSLPSEILRRRRAQRISPGSLVLVTLLPSSLSLPCLPNEIRSIFHRGGISRSEPTAGGIPPGSSSLIIGSSRLHGSVTSAGIRLSDAQLSPHTRGDLCLRLSIGFGSVLVEGDICLGPTASHIRGGEDSPRDRRFAQRCGGGPFSTGWLLFL